MDTSESQTFPGRFDSLSAINRFVTRMAKAAGLGPRAVYAVQVAVDEACSNIIEHAYGGEGRGPIELTCHIDDEKLAIVFHDYGCSFDPACVHKPDLKASLQERIAGGLGVYFIRQLMDRVQFESVPGAGNTLTLVKHRETAA